MNLKDITYTELHSDSTLRSVNKLEELYRRVSLICEDLYMDKPNRQSVERYQRDYNRSNKTPYMQRAKAPQINNNLTLI